MMSDTAWLWKYDEKIRSEPEDGVATIRKLLEQLELHCWPEKDVFGIHMAMEEAVMNAIKHGNQSLPDKQVHIRLTLTEADFYAQITDQGTGFNPDDVPDPTAEENLEKFSGRGLMLIRNFVDRIQYNDVGNSIELFKAKTK